MQYSGTGAVVGALVGAVGRAAVVLVWMAVVGIWGAPITVVLPSAAIGLLVGAIAGAQGKPVRGAVVGAVLSGCVFELFICACASVLHSIPLLDRGADELFGKTLPYALLMGLAGAAAGGIGGAVATRVDNGGSEGVRGLPPEGESPGPAGDRRGANQPDGAERSGTETYEA